VRIVTRDRVGWLQPAFGGSEHNQSKDGHQHSSNDELQSRTTPPQPFGMLLVAAGEF